MAFDKKKVFVRYLLTYIKTFSPVKLKLVFVFENLLFIKMACMYCTDARYIG